MLDLLLFYDKIVLYKKINMNLEIEENFDFEKYVQSIKDLKIEKFLGKIENTRHIRFLSIAKDLAKNSDFPIFKLGVVIVKQNKIIAKGFNSLKTHPMQKLYNKRRENFTKDLPDHPIHAEMQALNSIKHMDLSNAEMFIVRVGRDGGFKMAKPCDACLTKIYERDLKKIHYTTEEGLITDHLNNKKDKPKI